MQAVYSIIVLSLVSLHVIKANNNEFGDLGGYIVSSESDDEGSPGEATTTDKANTKDAEGQKISRLKGIQYKAQEVAGNLYESFHGKSSNGQAQDGVKQKVVEYLDPLRRRSIQFAGNLYEKTVPLRIYWGKAWKVMSKVNLETLSKGKQLDSIMEALTNEITAILPESTGIDPTEIHSKGTKYICGMTGKIWDLKSIKYVRMSTKSEDGKIIMYITYKFNNLFFTYDTFYINIVKAVRLKGKLFIKYKKNRITLIVSVPNIPKLLWNIAHKECILTAVGFEVGIMKFDDCFILSNSNFRRGQSEQKIREYLEENEDDFKKTFETQVLVEIHRALAVSGDWICKDPAVGDEVKKRGGTLEEYVPSRKFRKKCLGEKRKWFSKQDNKRPKQ